MNQGGPVQVVIELERATETIRGTLVVDGAPAWGFFGWLELMHGLERAMAESEDAQGE